MATQTNNPRQFGSFAELDAYLDSHTEPTMSENPCPCGELKQYGHRLCPVCKKRNRRATMREAQRRRRRVG